ncbi:hypothetical protein PBY51_007171 [Eleginops maclovinus]|nr:hypothetical protein PBY51_007171 [Eleginops maclovinus]
MEAAACSRGPAPGSPYPIQLGFVIGSPGLKDTVHHLTRLNACKMSNQRCVWSLQCLSRPPSCRLPHRTPETPLMISGADLWFPLTSDPRPRIHCCWGKRAGTWVPTIHQTRLIFHPTISAADCDITPDPESARYGS